METFDIPLKNEEIKTYKLIVILLVILHAAFFLYLSFGPILWKRGIAGLIICALYGGYRFFIFNTVYEKLSFESTVFFCFSLVLLYVFPWVWAIDLILSVLSNIAFRSTILYFRPTSIVKRNFPSKRYTWDQFSNVILKDNILTLDFKNNKLFQSEIENITIDENAFNTFAKAQLNK